jgi:hypothetical protein
MKIAMLYAAWDGEGWSTPIGVHRELIRRGHEVELFNLYHNNGEIMPGKNARIYSADCLNQLNHQMKNGFYKPDVVFQMDYGMFDAPQLDKQWFPGTTWIMEAGDEPQSHRMNWQKAHKFHAVLTPDYPCVERYNAAGIYAEWWTHHADEYVFKPYADVQEEFDCVTTCGGRRVTAEVQKALGEAFNNKRYFFGEDHARRLNMGKMVFQCSQHGEITRRVFEGMACGKMVITDRLPAETRIEDLFQDGRDIVYYDNAKDAIEKIKYYATHDEERQRIAQNGFLKVLENHSVTKRVDQLESVIAKVNGVSV